MTLFAVLEAHGEDSTLAFSETGSRSHFWAPLGTATMPVAGAAWIRASWVTAAHEADSYVWSSRPLAQSNGATTPSAKRPGSTTTPSTHWWYSPPAPGALGFPPDTAERLAALHTRNFM